MNKKILVNEERLEKLLGRFIYDCPAGIFNYNEKIPWCSEEYCINRDKYDCIKKWLGVKELPQKKELITKKIYKYLPINFYNDGYNACLDEILREDK